MGLSSAVAAFLHPVGLFRLAIGTPDAWQARLLGILAEGKPDTRVAVVCSRQSGKTSATACAAVWLAWTRRDQHILVVGPTQAHGSNLVERAAMITAELPAEARPMRASRTRLVFPTGSDITAVPGDTPSSVRGHTVHHLLFDEAGWVKPETFESALPTVTATSGQVAMCSTPNGKQGPLWTAWSGEAGEWVTLRAPASEIERFDPADLRRRRAELGTVRYSVEYECEFVAPAGAAFAPEVLAPMREYAPLSGDEFWSLAQDGAS